MSLSDPKTSVHSSKGRLVVTRMEPRSQRWLKTSKSSSAPVVDRGTKRACAPICPVHSLYELGITGRWPMRFISTKWLKTESGLSWSTPGLLPVLLGSPQVRMAYPTVTHTDMAMSAWFIAGVGTGRLPLLAFSGQKALNAFG